MIAVAETDEELELFAAIRLAAAPRGFAEPPLEPPAGILLVSIAERPELLERAWHAVGAAGYEDAPTPSAVSMTLERWLAEEATRPDGSLVALERGEVVV